MKIFFKYHACECNTFEFVHALVQRRIVPVKFYSTYYQYANFRRQVKPGGTDKDLKFLWNWVKSEMLNHFSSKATQLLRFPLLVPRICDVLPLLLITKYQNNIRWKYVTKNENWWLFYNQITAKKVQLLKFKVLFNIFDADSNPNVI